MSFDPMMFSQLMMTAGQNPDAVAEMLGQLGVAPPGMGGPGLLGDGGQLGAALGGAPGVGQVPMFTPPGGLPPPTTSPAVSPPLTFAPPGGLPSPTAPAVPAEVPPLGSLLVPASPPVVIPAEPPVAGAPAIPPVTPPTAGTGEKKPEDKNKVDYTNALAVAGKLMGGSTDQKPVFGAGVSRAQEAPGQKGLQQTQASQLGNAFLHLLMPQQNAVRYPTLGQLLGGR